MKKRSLIILSIVFLFPYHAVMYACGCKDTAQYINCLTLEGRSFMENEDLEKSLFTYKEAFRLAEAQKDNHALALIEYDVSQLCYNWGHVVGAADFALKSVNFALQTNDNELIGKAYSFLGMYYCELGRKKEGVDILENKAIPLLKATNSELQLCKTYHRLITTYGEMGKISMALHYMELFDRLTQYLKVNEDWLHYYKSKLTVALLTKQYQKALTYIQKSQEIIEGQGYYNNNNHQIYRMAAECYKELGDLTMSNKMYERAYLLRTQSILKRQELQITYYSVEHRIQEKEAEIVELQQQQYKQEADLLYMRNWWVISISILSILILFLLYKRQRQKIHLVEMARAAEEKERQMLLLQKNTERRLTFKYIEGLEAERHRLAAELHDDICNSLMGLEMKTRSLTNEMSAEAAEQIEVLADIRNRVRNVSHELMPPVFQFATLDEMLKDHIKHLELPERMEAKYTSTEGTDWGVIPEKIGFEFYRIAQEALSNCIKHSEASLISVSLQLADNQLSASVRDNGVGFDMDKKKGIGLRTICQRIHNIGGTCEVQSKPGVGTSVEVSITLGE